MTSGEIGSLAGAAVALIGVIVTMLIVSAKMGKMTGVIETGQVNQGAILADMKNELTALRVVTTDVAVFRADLANLTQQVSRLDQAINELRHGEGFVFPLNMTGREKQR